MEVLRRISHPRRIICGSRSPRSRRGYALVTVMVFTTILSSWYMVSIQRTAGALRFQRLKTLQEIRDAGAVQALAKTLSLLETGFPSTGSLIGGVS